MSSSWALTSAKACLAQVGSRSESLRAQFVNFYLPAPRRAFPAWSDATMRMCLRRGCTRVRHHHHSTAQVPSFSSSGGFFRGARRDSQCFVSSSDWRAIAAFSSLSTLPAAERPYSRRIEVHALFVRRLAIASAYQPLVHCRASEPCGREFRLVRPAGAAPIAPLPR